MAKGIDTRSKKIHNDLTAEYVRSILHYNPETGFFVWQKRTDVPPEWNTQYAGVKAGRTNKCGYNDICINYKRYRAPRLAWLYMTGEWPPRIIDHRDLNKSNDKWENLRASTMPQNLANISKPRHNTSGFKGVSWDKSKRKWKASIKVGRQTIHLGRFDDIHEAHKVYCAKLEQLHGEFARAN
jgi:HNH endonuclease